MKNLFLLLLCIVVMFSVVAAVNAQSNKFEAESANQMNKGVLIIVNGTRFEDQSTYIYERDGRCLCDLPFVKILELLGYPVEWKTDQDAEFEVKGEVFDLPLLDSTLCPHGESNNILKPIPGNSIYFCEAKEHEMYLQDQVIQQALRSLGIKAEITLNLEENTITVLSDEVTSN